MKHLQCSKCGNSEVFYIKERYRGTCNFYFRPDGKDADNTELYGNAIHYSTSKFVFCSECDAKVGKVREICPEWE